jgi:hypothetical protein
LQTQFEEQKAHVANGMQEMYQGVEKFKKDETSKKNDMNKHPLQPLQEVQARLIPQTNLGHLQLRAWIL